MKLKYTALALAAVLCFSLTACDGSHSSSGAASQNSESSTSSASSVAVSSAVSEVASESQLSCLEPLESFTVSKDGEALTTKIMPDGTVTTVAVIQDGTYAANIGSDGVVTVEYGEDTTTLHSYTLQLYAYDIYNMAAVEKLKVGDTISTHTGDGEETREVVIETIEAADGLVTINGGVEEGGMNLLSENGTYRTLLMDNYPVYYPIGGEVSLTLASGVTLRDSSVNGIDVAVTNGDAAVAEAVSADESGVGFGYGNTTITVQDGQIVEITRVWVP